MIKNSIWHHNIIFLSKKGHILSFLSSFPNTTSFFPQRNVPECKPGWNRGAIAVFSRLPSLRRLQATPLLQTSLVNLRSWSEVPSFLLKCTEKRKRQSRNLTYDIRTACFPPFNFKPFFEHEAVGNQKN